MFHRQKSWTLIGRWSQCSFVVFFSHWRRALDFFISSINSKGNPSNEPAWELPPQDLEWFRYSLNESQWSYQLNQAVLKWSKVLAGDSLERTNYFKHYNISIVNPMLHHPRGARLKASHFDTTGAQEETTHQPRREPDWFPQGSAPTWKDPANVAGIWTRCRKHDMLI